MSFNHSASNCMKSLLIICTKSAEVTSKQCSGAILISLFFLIKAFQNYSFGWKKDLLNFFFFLNYLFNKVWWLLSPRKSCALKNSWLHACSWFLSNIFKSLVISFVYLTNHFTNSRIKLYTFCILSVQSQHKNNVKTTLHKTLF